MGRWVQQGVSGVKTTAFPVKNPGSLQKSDVFEQKDPLKPGETHGNPGNYRNTGISGNRVCLPLRGPGKVASLLIGA